MPNVQYISTKPVTRMAHVIELAEVGSIFFLSFGSFFIFRGTFFGRFFLEVFFGSFLLEVFFWKFSFRSFFRSFLLEVFFLEEKKQNCETQKTEHAGCAYMAEAHRPRFPSRRDRAHGFPAPHVR